MRFSTPASVPPRRSGVGAVADVARVEVPPPIALPAPIELGQSLRSGLGRGDGPVDDLNE